MTLRRLFYSPFRTFSLNSLAALSLLLLSGCGAGNFGRISETTTPETSISLNGFVKGGQQPISGATVQLYTVGTTTDKSAATPLIIAPFTPPVTDLSGSWSITGLYHCPSITQEVYLVSSGGNPGLSTPTNNNAAVLVSALGPCGNLSSATFTIINEVSTIASIYPITPFMSSYLNVGSSSGNAPTLADDFMKINQYVDTTGGQSPGPALPGGFTAPVANLNSLANSMSACVNSDGKTTSGTPCGNLFLYATPPGGTAPTNTADAILDIANYPTQNVGNIFLLSNASAAFQPVLSAAPADWTLKILPNITLTTPSNLVGVGSTTTGTITLGQAAPAGGLVVNLVSSTTADVTVVNPVNIPAGATTASFSYTGVASGSSTIAASAIGYYGSSTTLASTNALISLGALPTVAPGQATSLALSLGTPAPAGGVTISFTSTTPGIATVTPSVFIAGGLQVPVSNPQVTGVTVGNAVINATASGYAPGSRSVNVSVTASLPSTFSVPLTTPDNEILTISAPAPAGGITFALSVENNAVFSVPSTVTVPQGSTTVNIPITGLANGTSNLRADSPNITEAVSAVTVNGTIALQASAVTTGKQIQVPTYFFFNAPPPSAITATITSSNPAAAVVSANANLQGGGTATIPGILSGNTNTYYVQGVGVGASTLTISAPGYSNATVSVTVDPSGFVIYSPGSLTTTTLSVDSSLNIFPAILNPATLGVLTYGAVTPAAVVNVALTSSDATVGTMNNSPVSFAANAGSAVATFHPVGAGTANVTLVTPAGFSTPTPSTTQQIIATVTAPPIGVQSATFTTGKGIEMSTYAYLTQLPLTPTTMTITSNNPSVLAVSTSPTVAGGATATVSAVVNSSSQAYYLQGLQTGTATVTISAPSYTSATVTVTVAPSGFIIYSPGSITTTTLSPTTSINVFPAILNAGGTVLTYGTVTPQFSPVSVPLTSGTTTVGTIATSPLVFHGGDSNQTGTFQPVGAGTSLLSLGTPTNFSTPGPIGTQQITATVTATPISFQSAAMTTGKNLEVSTYVYLTQTPTAPVTLSLVSDTPSVVTISTNAALAGAASNAFPNTVNANTQTFYLQGQGIGTAIITASAPGYSSATMTVTVNPSGFIIYSPGSIATTTFSTPTSINIFPAILYPNSTVFTYATLNPGIGTVSVPVSSSSTPVGTVTTSVSFAGGSSNGVATFTPIAAGTSNVTIMQPAGFTTPTPVGTQQIVATVTAPVANVEATARTTGQNLEVATYAYLSQTPPSPVTLTLVSTDPTIATISTSLAVAGGSTLTFPGLANGNVQTYYIQGHNQGSTTITVSAPGFTNSTVNVTVNPSGFVIYSPGSISTTTFSNPSSINIFPAILTPGTFTVISYATVSPSAGSPQVTMLSGTPATGTVSSPITFAPGSSGATASFQPVAAGTTTLTLAQPAGFTAPNPLATQQITATVTATPVGIQQSAVTTGQGLQVATYAYLSQLPPTATTLTISSSNPAAVTVSTSAALVGGASISFPSLTNTNAQSYYVQGQAVGSSNLTVSAPGFTPMTVTVTVDPSGFVIYSPGTFSTTTFSTPTTVNVFPAILTPGVLTVLNYAVTNPNVSASIPVTSSNTAVGTVSTPILFPGNSGIATFSFQPGTTPGTSLLSLGTVAGFTTPSQVSTQQSNATVTAPPIGLQAATVTTGVELEVSSYAYLGVTPPSPVTLTVTSNDPTTVLVSTSPTAVGSASIAFGGPGNTNAQTFYIQGQKIGTTTLTVSAPGFTPATISVAVNPSAFVIYSPSDFSTTTGATATTVTFFPAILNPGVLTVSTYGMISPGFGTISLPVGSTSPAIGTVAPTSPSFIGGQSSATTLFTPIKTGTTDVVIVSQPTGFTTPSQPITQQIVVTVN